MNSSQDYTNAIFESMDILINKKIEQISFDSTIEATVIDASQASKGIYMVSNGSASFTATSTETGYKEKDIVLVTIPEGNYDNQKIIISKKPKDNADSPLIFRSPFENLIDVSNNIISGEYYVNMIANGGQEYGWDEGIDFKDSSAHSYIVQKDNSEQLLALVWDSEDLFEEGEFNHSYIGLKGQFSTWLNDYHTAGGNYGLAMEITFTHRDYVLAGDFSELNSTENQEENQAEKQNILKDRDTFSFSKIVCLDSSDFFGDIYNFETYYTQEATFDISEYSDFPITRIRLFAYQRNNFINKDQEKIYSEKDTEDFSTILPNIFIKDPYICFGQARDSFETDFANIITKQSLVYTKTLPKLPVLTESNSEEIPKDSRNIFIIDNNETSITKILKPQIRAKNSFFKLLKKVYLNKGYSRKRIVEVFNALVAANTYQSQNKEKTFINNSYLKWDNVGIIEKGYNEGRWEKTGEKISNFGTYENNFKTIYDNQIKECKDVTLSNKEQTDYCFKTIEDILKDLLTYENRSLNNKKEIELRWIHKEDDSNLINAIQEGLLPPGYHIYWYYYKIGAPSPDEYMGAQWVRFYGCSENPDDSGNYCLTESEIQEDEDEATDHINVIFHPNVNKASEQLRAVIVKNELTNNSNEVLGRVIARSNILTFNNQSEVSNRATIIDTNALAIKIQDKEQGHYFLYNRAKQLFSTNENVLRQLIAVFDVDEDQVDNKKELEAPCVSIKWIVPAKDTMIEPVIVHKNNSQQLIRNVMANKSADEKVDIDNGIYSIEYDNSDKENYIFVQKDVTSEENILKYMYYKIAKNLTYSNNRNTIYLEVNKDGQTYTASVQLLFGTAGTSGSDYTIVVDWEKGQGVLDIGQDEPTLSGQAYLIDQDGLRVDLDQVSSDPDKKPKFQYEWYQVYCEKMQAKDRIEKEQIIPTEDYFYPVNNQMLQKMSMIVPSEAENGDIQLKNISLDVAYFANAADETGLQGTASIIDGNGKLREDLYKYDVTTHKYVKWLTKDSQVNANINDDFQKYIWYAVSVAKTSRDKIEFIPFDFVTTEPGKISGDTNNYYGVITFDENGKSTFHYDTRALNNTGKIIYNGVEYDKGYKKAFIKDGDNFIIDPYDQYYSDLTYYYPQAINKSKTKEVGLVVQPTNEEGNKNNCKFLIEKDTESSDKLSINNLYTLQIKLTGFGDYNLIAHFPITLKDETSNSDIILDALEGATEVRYTTSGELDFNKTPYVLKMRYKDDDDNWQAVNSNSGKFNEKFNGQWSLINSEQNQDFYLTNINKKQEDFVDELIAQWGKISFTLTEETLYTYWQLFNQSIFETASKQRTEVNKNIILSKIKKIIANESLQTIASSVTDVEDEDHCISFLKGKTKNFVDQDQNSLSRPGLNNKEFLSLITILIKYGWFDDSHVPFTSTTLSFPNVYFKNLGLCGIQFKVFSKSSTSSNEPLAVWTQPIYIYQDNYPSTTLNKWGGAEIVTDNDTGTILANGFSAGKKEKDNTFTGVVLGDWSKTDTDAVITKQTGIYGFNHGIMTYALKDDGTAFFGGDGGGRIYLNGTNATIYSANWIKSSAEPKTSLNGNLYQLESEGMKIDLASGKLLIQKNVIFQGIANGADFIDHRKIQLNSDGFIISRNHYAKSTPEEDEYKTINLFELKINNKDTADDVFEKISYALRTPDYLYNVTQNSGESPGAGMEINLGNKTITSFGKNVFQLGGYRHTSFWEGFQCLIQTADTPESSNRVLQIGQYYTNGNIVTPFFVELGGHVHCNSITVNYDLNCSRISSSGRVEIHGYQKYGDDNVHYSLVCWESAGTATRGNIFCGNINCFDVNCSGITSSKGVEIHGVQWYQNNTVKYSLACWESAGTTTRGNIFCGNINCSSITANGNINCSSITANGNINCSSITANGNLNCSNITANGNLNCSNIDCSNIKLSKLTADNQQTFPANWIVLVFKNGHLKLQREAPSSGEEEWVRCLIGGSIEHIL